MFASGHRNSVLRARLLLRLSLPPDRAAAKKRPFTAVCYDYGAARGQILICSRKVRFMSVEAPDGFDQIRVDRAAPE